MPPKTNGGRPTTAKRDKSRTKTVVEERERASRKHDPSKPTVGQSENASATTSTRRPSEIGTSSAATSTPSSSAGTDAPNQQTMDAGGKIPDHKNNKPAQRMTAPAQKPTQQMMVADTPASKTTWAQTPVPQTMEPPSPVKFDIVGHTFQNTAGHTYNYYVPPTLTQKVCCGRPMGAPVEEQEQASFQMEFKCEKNDDKIRFQQMISGRCSLDSNFVQVFKDGKEVGHLEKPFSCCEKICPQWDELLGNDILIMSFRKGAGETEKEMFTIRKKGAGCGCGSLLSLCACPRLGCKCKGVCADFHCFGTIGIPTVLNETFRVYGPMAEAMTEPKAAITISHRRGLNFGNAWVPDSASIHAPDIKDEEDLLLLMAFVYGSQWQNEWIPGSFPEADGLLWYGMHQGAGKDVGEEVPEHVMEGRPGEEFA